MTRKPLMYGRGYDVRLIDPEYERLIGIYDTHEQAAAAWVCYMSQGRVGQGFDINKDDEYVIDQWRRDTQIFNARCIMKGTLRV